MKVYVCPLSRLHETVTLSGAQHLVTLMTPPAPVQRPVSILAKRHLLLNVNDISKPLDGYVLAGEEHVERLITFIRSWKTQERWPSPLVIHCWAGISRSTAAAFITLCALSPEQQEMSLALQLREASPTATPNPRLVALADQHLDRNGRMVEAIAVIGRGKDAFEGKPFSLDIPS